MKQTAVSGQAVLEGVMMRSPETCVIAIRLADGSIKLNKNPFPELSFEKTHTQIPFLRGVLLFYKSLVIGLLSFFYSMEVLKEDQKKVGSSLSLFLVLTVGLLLFFFIPHFALASLDKLLGLNLNLSGFGLHIFLGVIKASLFLFYLRLLDFVPEIKRVFQYNGAQRKSLGPFMAQPESQIETSFIFYVFFLSVIFLSPIPMTRDLPPILSNIVNLIMRALLMFPIAGIAYELIKFSLSRPSNFFCRVISYPSIKLLELTTKEPTDQQLEIAQCAIKAVLKNKEKEF